MDVEFWLKLGWHLKRDVDYGGERLEVGTVILTRGAKRALSRTAWALRGRRVRENTCPHATPLHSLVDVFREEQTEPIQIGNKQFLAAGIVIGFILGVLLIIGR